MPYWRLFYHIVWATRDRLPLIGPEIEAEVHRQVRLAAQRSDVLIHALGGTADHIHRVGSIPPSIAVASAVGKIKGGSAHAVNRLVGNGESGWQAEYGVVSFAERHLPHVVATSMISHAVMPPATLCVWERMDPEATEPGAT